MDKRSRNRTINHAQFKDNYDEIFQHNPAKLNDEMIALCHLITDAFGYDCKVVSDGEIIYSVKNGDE